MPLRPAETNTKQNICHRAEKLYRYEHAEERTYALHF